MSRRPDHRLVAATQGPAPKGIFQVGALASKVISVLHERSIAENALLCDAIIDRLLAAIIDPKDFDAEAVLAMLRSSRLSYEDIVSCYIPEAARHLGCRWNQSDMSFAQVSTASARLQDLVRLMSSDWSIEAGRRSTALQLGILLVICEDDLHTLGCATIAARLRYAGHSVRLVFGATQQDVRKAMRQDWYDLVMFSCARRQALDTVSQVVKHIHATMRDVPPLILGGLILPQVPDAQTITGVDLATNDLQLALKLCDARAVGKKLVAE